MKIHHISEAGVSFEIQFGVWIKMGWRTQFLHMAANYRLNGAGLVSIVKN